MNSIWTLDCKSSLQTTPFLSLGDTRRLSKTKTVIFLSCFPEQTEGWEQTKQPIKRLPIESLMPNVVGEHRDFLRCQSRSLQSYSTNVSTVTHVDGNQWWLFDYQHQGYLKKNRLKWHVTKYGPLKSQEMCCQGAQIGDLRYVHLSSCGFPHD